MIMKDEPINTTICTDKLTKSAGSDLPSEAEIRELIRCNEQLRFENDICWKLFNILEIDRSLVQAAFENAVEKASNNFIERMHFFNIKVGRKVICIDPSEVEYIESDDKKIRLFINGECLETYGSLRKTLQKLPNTFVQCQKSFVVNMDHIQELDGDRILLSSGVYLPMSQKYRHDIRTAFSQRRIRR